MIELNLETRRIKLLPLEEKHFPILSEWRNDPVFLENCTNRHSHITYNRFVNELKKDFERDRHEQFLIQLKSNGEPIGTTWKTQCAALALRAMTTRINRAGRLTG